MFEPFHRDESSTLYHGHCLAVLYDLPAASVDCVVSSPPYWGLRDYQAADQLGNEATLAEYVTNLTWVGAALRHVLKPSGTFWLNLGDTYSRCGAKSAASNRCKESVQEQAGRQPPLGIKPKSLCGVPWRVALSLLDDGWTLRNEIIWHKLDAKPENVRDRLTRAHEQVFFFTRGERYYFHQDAVREPCSGLGGAAFGKVRRAAESTRCKAQSRRCTPAGRERYLARGRNKRTVWHLATSKYRGAHFATFPESLVEPCLLAGCPAGGVVLDPFVGSGTTLAVAKRLGYRGIGIDVNADSLKQSVVRLQGVERHVFA